MVLGATGQVMSEVGGGRLKAKCQRKKVKWEREPEAGG